MKIVGIIQVRMGSSRLPNKALEDMSGISAIERMIARVKLSKKLNVLYIATGVSSKNDILVERIKNIRGIKIFRGDDENVLDRFYKIANIEKANVLVRMTGDCPLIDPNIIDQVIHKALNNSPEHVALLN